MDNNLNRFLEAQKDDYEIALSEIRAGIKSSHWMWYIFPQYKGLGYSSTSKFYEIKDTEEARSFLNHPLLGSRLLQISAELLNLEENNATKIMGRPDDLKLRSCMTLFLEIDNSEDIVFRKVLEKFFEGQTDQRTLKLLRDNP